MKFVALIYEENDRYLKEFDKLEDAQKESSLVYRTDMKWQKKEVRTEQIVQESL